MKSKKSLAILIPALLLVWGIIGVKIIKQLHPSQEDAGLPVVQTKPNREKPMVKNYSLINNYPDPFLKEIKSPQIKEEPNKRSMQLNSKQKGQIWPQIQYKGCIKSKHSQTALIELNTSKVLLQQNEEKYGLTLLFVHNDSITVQYNGEKKSFFSNKKNEP